MASYDQYIRNKINSAQGTAIADITSKMITETAYRWKYFHVGFPILETFLIKFSEKIPFFLLLYG